MQAQRLHIPGGFTGATFDGIVGADGRQFTSFQRKGVMVVRVNRPDGSAGEFQLPPGDQGEVLTGRGQFREEGGALYVYCWSENHSPRDGYKVGPIPEYIPRASGGYTPLALRVVRPADWTGGRMIVTPPPGVAYNVRVTASGAQGARVRVGPSDDSMQVLTLSLETAGVRDYESGIVNAGPGGTLMAWGEGELVEVFVDVLGVWE